MRKDVLARLAALVVFASTGAGAYLSLLFADNKGDPVAVAGIGALAGLVAPLAVAWVVVVVPAFALWMVEPFRKKRRGVV